MKPLTESQELAILASDARLQLALAAGRMGIWEWDAVTNNVVWDGTEHRIAGSGAERAITPEQFFQVVHPEDRHRVETAFRGAVEHQAAFESEFRVIRPTGEERWLVGRGMPLVREGRTYKVVGVNFDITDRKRSEQARQEAEAALRKAHGLIRAITDNATTAIFMLDGRGAITFMNPAAEAMIGYAFGEVRGKRLQQLIHPPQREGAAPDTNSIGLSIATQAPVREREERFIDRHGRAIPVRCNASPILADGQLSGIVLEVRDITAEKRAQAVLEEADRRKDHFLATLAHELRNPLAPIRNALHVLGADGADTDRVRWAAGLMERQVAQLVRLIDDLLDISRITLDKLTLRLQPTALREVVNVAVETSHPAIAERGHRFTVELPPEPLWVQADATRLAQVIANLLNNAAKYSDPGARISLRATAENGMAVIRVRDTGKGIEANFLPRIFDLYAQAGRPAEHPGEGLGIGLALVKKLVDLHRGRVEAHSEGPGHGSEFVVRIPLADARSVASTIAQVPQTATARLRVLVVDDNPDAADSLMLALAQAGHEASVAYTGRDAIEIALRTRPDAIVLDIGMADIDGYEVARRIRRESWGAGVRLIALTGWGQRQDRERALAAGFDHHLTKPADPRDLIARLAGA